MSMCICFSSTTFLRWSASSRWIGLRPTTPRTGPFLPLHLDPLADEDLRVPAADRRELEEALLVDVGDDEADLVDVADDREQRRGVRLADPGDRGADAVAARLGEGGGARARPRRPVPRSRRARGRAGARRAGKASRSPLGSMHQDGTGSLASTSAGLCRPGPDSLAFRPWSGMGSA